MLFWRHFTFTIIWAIGIMILYLLSNSELSVIDLSSLFEPDKLAHAGVFCVLMCSLTISLFKQQKYKKLRRHSIRNGFIITTVYGTLLELSHGIHSDRAFDLLDIVANEVGAFLGIVIIRLIFKDIIT